jgi:RNA polymerase sigma factor (sigma-70 family)
MTQACESVIMARLAEEPTGLPMTVEQFYDRYATVFWRYFAVRTAGDTHAADDLAQHLWLQARLKGSSMRGGNVEAWLWQVARNLLRLHYRKRGTAELPEADPGVVHCLAEKLDSEPLPDEVLSRREIRDQLLLTLTSLPVEHQVLLVGYYFDGRTELVLAEELGVSPRAIEGRLYRARHALRDKLAHLGTEVMYERA